MNSSTRTTASLPIDDRLDLDEEQQRQARLVMFIAFSLGVFVALAAVVAALMWTIRHGVGPIAAIAPNPNATIRWWHTPTLAIAAALFSQSGRVARAGRARLAAWMILAIMDMILLLQAVFLTATVPVVMGFVIPSLVTAILLDARSTVLHGIVAFVVGAAFLLSADVQNPNLSTTLGMLLTVISMAVAISLVRERDVIELNGLRSSERAEAERIQGELRLARRVQLAMHPTSFPEVPGVEIAAFSEPAFEASGDFYDVFQVVHPETGENHVAMCVCDVAGKGIASALVMSATRASLRSAAARTYSPADVLGEVNATLTASIPPELFVTASYAIFDPKLRSIVHASAGHPHPLIWNAATGEVGEIEAFGMPLGLVPEADYANSTNTLDPGSALALYSDGLPEALNADREFFGFEQVAIDFGEVAAAFDSAEVQLEHLLGRLRAFVGDTPFDDDVTAVVLS